VRGGGGGAVCAADAMVSDSQWTALDDSRHRELFGRSGDGVVYVASHSYTSDSA
jgi:hypothetical protein